MQEFNDDNLEHGRAMTADRKHQDDSEEVEDEGHYSTLATAVAALAVRYEVGREALQKLVA